MKKIMKNGKGFTLIELLVVIAIIGILAVFTLAFLAPARQKGRDAKRKEDLNAVAKALELYYSDNNAYPVATNDCSGAAALCTAAGFDALVDPLVAASPKYIPSKPEDPTVTNGYRGGTNATDQGYALEATVENPNDPQKVVVAATNIFRLCGGTFTVNCSK